MSIDKMWEGEVGYGCRTISGEDLRSVEDFLLIPEQEREPSDRKKAADSRTDLTEELKPALSRPMPAWKRFMDVVGAVLALIAFSPVMIATAVAVKVTSKGPVIFRQQRAGLGGRPFTCYKFRSMVVDAEARKAGLLKYNERSGVAFKMTNDPRVTWVGRIIRRTSLDELPQFFNVLKGDMSLVGPRPLPIDEALEQDAWHRARLEITPGITCVWQIRARHNRCFDDWARLDIEYIRRRSFSLDVKLLLLTIPAVLSMRGAC